MSSKFTVLCATAMLGMTLASCGEKDYFDPDYSKKEFAQSFKQAFPSADLNQSWDFTTPGSTYASTRADITPQVSQSWYEVEKGTIEFFQKELEEGQNNRAKGNPFIMSVPNNGFGIVPIYQGGASWVWDMHMVIEQSGVVLNDVKVWEKHRDLQCQIDDETLQKEAASENFATEFGFTRNAEGWYGTKQSFGFNPGNWWENYEYGWNTMHAKNIRAKFIDFANLPVGANIYFYLSVWGSQEDKDNGLSPMIQSSLSNMMVALTDVPRPSNVDEKNEVTIIGCEDNNGDDSDWDMNDLVFMVVGYPDVPKPIVIENEQYDEIVANKRYMVEDLGATNDFDFNDIVVDVKEVRTHKITITNGAKTNDEVVATKQLATVRAMGGTIDFTLKIGDTTWKKSDNFDVKTMYSTTEDNIDFASGLSTFEVTGWEPAKNNISVTVDGRASSELSIEFPKTGEIPMIIAVNPTINWKGERVRVSERWWTEGPSNEY